MPSENLTIRDRLIAAQADMANPIKSKAVQAGARRYNYEVLPDVLEIVTTALNAHGLGLLQGVKPIVSNSYAETPEMSATDVIHSWILRTAVTDGTADLVLDVRPIDFPSDPQVAGSKETYTRRYALKTAFGLAGVDDDGEAAHRIASGAPQSLPKAAPYPNQAKEPNRGRFEQIGLLKQRLEAAGFDTAVLKTDLANITGKPDMRNYTAEDIQKAETYLSGILESMKGVKDGRY